MAKRKKGGKLKRKILVRVVRANKRLHTALEGLAPLGEFLARPFKKEFTSLQRAAKDYVAIEEILLKGKGKKEAPRKEAKPEKKGKQGKKKLKK